MRFTVRRFLALSLVALLSFGQAQSAGDLLSLTGAGGKATATGYSAEAAQFFARITDPGTTRKNQYAAAIDCLVSNSVWTPMQMLMLYAADIQANALINLKSSSFPNVNNGSVTFTANQGFTGDAATNYLQTGYVPSVNGSQDSQTIGVYILNNRTTTASKIAIGSQDVGGANPLAIGPLWLGGFTWTVNSTAQLVTQTNTTSQGSFAATRRGATDSEGYKNGASLGTNATASSGLNNDEYYILALNANSTPLLFSDDQIAAAWVATGMTTGQVQAVQSCINGYMTALGINVY